MSTANLARAVRTRAEAKFISFAFVVLIVLNVSFPKAGIKVAGLPLTWGYFAIAFFGLIAALTFPSQKAPRVAPAIQMGLGFLPLSLLVVVKLLDPEGVVRVNLIWLVNFFILPFTILILFARNLELIPDQKLARVFTLCVRFIVAWGIMNFILYATTKETFDIPYVTVNADDLDVFSKNNRRGGLMKLVSTYNNGNIFGACALLLGPLYLACEPDKKWRGLFILAIVLTLSRTAWFGLGCMLGIMTLTGQMKWNRASIWVMIGAVAVMFPFLFGWMNWTAGNLLEANLGGRGYQVERLRLSAFGTPSVKVLELVYVTLLQSFGLAGFVAVVVALFTPVFYGVALFRQLSKIQKAALAGISTYLIIAAIDGAFLLIPVIAQYLFVCAILYRKQDDSGAVDIGRPGQVVTGAAP